MTTEHAAGSELLPRKQKPRVRSNRLRSLGSFLVQVGIGVVGGMTLILSYHALIDPLSSIEAWIALALLLPICLLHVALHELGHAGAGLAVGMELHGFSLGPVHWERQSRGWNARWGRGLRGILGYVFMLPPRHRCMSRGEVAIHVAAGPATNIATALLIYVVMPKDAGVGLANSLWWLALISAGYFGLVNLVPFSTSGTRSDGGQLLDLAVSPRSHLAGQQLQQVVNLSRDGVRPRDWPLSLVPQASELESIKPPIRTSYAYLAGLRAIDAGDATTAGICACSLVKDFDTAEGAAATGIALMMATYAAACTRDSELLAAWLPHIGEHWVDLRAQVLWLKAVQARLELRTHDALQFARESRELMASMIDEGSRVFLGDQLDLLEAELGSSDHAMRVRA